MPTTFKRIKISQEDINFVKSLSFDEWTEESAHWANADFYHGGTLSPELKEEYDEWLKYLLDNPPKQ